MTHGFIYFVDRGAVGLLACPHVHKQSNQEKLSVRRQLPRFGSGGNHPDDQRSASTINTEPWVVEHPRERVQKSGQQYRGKVEGLAQMLEEHSPEEAAPAERLAGRTRRNTAKPIGSGRPDCAQKGAAVPTPVDIIYRAATTLLPSRTDWKKSAQTTKFMQCSDDF